MNDWASYVSAIAAGLSALVGVWVNRRKVKATAAESEARASEITVGAALDLLIPLKDRVVHLEDRVAHLEEGVYTLSIQVVNLGERPHWPKEPDDQEEEE